MRILLVISVVMALLTPPPAWSERTTVAEAELVGQNWLAYMVHEGGHWAGDDAPRRPRSPNSAVPAVGRRAGDGHRPGRSIAAGGPASIPLTTGTVAPGEELDITIQLTAPMDSGTYRGNWKLRNSSGIVFGIGAAAESVFWVEIVVPAPRAADVGRVVWPPGARTEPGIPIQFVWRRLGLRGQPIVT